MKSDPRWPCTTRRPALLLGLVALLAAAPAAASAQLGGLPEASLTVYSQDMALARVRLDRALPAGEHDVRVDDLPTSLDASSILLLDPGATLLGVRGQRLYRLPGSEEATSLSLVLQVQLDAAVDGLAVAFLTSGMSWSASYSMIVAGDDASAAIDGYATVQNHSGTAWPGATVQLLAGTVNTGGGGPRPMMMDNMRAMAEAAPQAPDLSPEAFGGYHLYELPGTVSLALGESRRVRMSGADSVTTSRELVLAQQVGYFQQYGEPLRQQVAIRYRVERPAGTAFGDAPLPAGPVRVYQRDDVGRLQLLGIDSIGNTPAEQELVLQTGIAFDVVGERTQTEFSQVSREVTESAWRIELTNESDGDVTVLVIERLPGDWEILQSTHEAERVSAGTARFRVDVPAGGEGILEYRVRVRR